MSEDKNMTEVKFEDADHSIFDLLNWVRKTPETFLDGDRSLRRLRSFLVGYECGLGRLHFSLRDHDLFHSFHDWVASKLGFGESTSGWCNMILARTKSDDEAYSKFFELLDEFCRTKGITR